MGDRSAEQMEGAENVDLRVEERLTNALGHARLCALVADGLDGVVGDHLVDRFGLPQIPLHEDRAFRNVLSMPRAQVIEDDHVVAGLQQRVGDVAADEAGAAGDQDLHEGSADGTPMPS